MTQNAVLIGTGMVASTYVSALADLSPGIALRGVHARSADSRRRFLAKHLPGGVEYPDVASIAADRDLDFALLVTPPDAREDIVTALATAGLPILMEKPVERSLASAQRICELCEATGVPLGIMLQHRLRPSALKMRELVSTGDLGPLFAMEITVPWWRPQAYYDAPGRGTRIRDGGGVMISQAIHTMDLVLSLCPPVQDVRAMTATTGFHRMECEDFVSAALRFQGGGAGHLFATTAAYPGRAEAIVLHYRNAAVTLASNALDIAWQDGREDHFGAAAATGAGADPMAFTHEWHRDVIADFAAALREDRPPAIPGRAALAVHALIEAIETAARTGQTVEMTQ